jgi:archaetidylinositol phosphate synthase
MRTGHTHASHVRVNHGLLAAAEKRTLVWMARRLPPWVNSDHLTLLALVAMAGIGGAFWAARFWRPALALAIVGLALNWFGDSLDGTVARVRGHERPRYGFYVDHVLDVAGITLLLGGLALSGFMSATVASCLLVAYLLTASEVFLATAVHGQFRMSFLNFGPTELRIVLAIGIARLLWSPDASVRPFGLGPFLLFDVGGVVAAFGLIIAFISSALRNTLMLYRAEPLPKVLRDEHTTRNPQSIEAQVSTASQLRQDAS